MHRGPHTLVDDDGWLVVWLWSRHINWLWLWGWGRGPVLWLVILWLGWSLGSVVGRPGWSSWRRVVGWLVGRFGRSSWGIVGWLGSWCIVRRFCLISWFGWWIVGWLGGFRWTVGWSSRGGGLVHRGWLCWRRGIVGGRVVHHLLYHWRLLVDMYGRMTSIDDVWWFISIRILRWIV
jgi:hypothetical protein